MIEKMVPLQFQPGVYRNGTVYQAKGRWHDSQLVRWFEGTLQPVGGWTDVLDNATSPAAITVDGFARGEHAWRFDDATSWMAIGTTGMSETHLYVYSDGVITDISPSDLANGDQDGGIPSGTNLPIAYGNGPYGIGPYSSGSGARSILEADTWMLDNFGEFLVANLTADGRILVWLNSRADDAVPLGDATLGTTTGTPPVDCIGVVVTPEHFLFALGADNNMRLVRWPSQESLVEWDVTDTTTAGDFELQSEGKIISGERLRRQTLIWTDVDLHAALYVGGEFIYRFEQVGDNCGLFAPRAKAMARGAAYWMSDKKFFMYDGQVQEVKCDVSDDIFNDINLAQRAKIWAVALPQYNEIWFYFPSKGNTTTECDRYAIFNYAESHWSVGRLARSGGIGRGVFDAPVWVTPDGDLLEHETGFNHDGEVPFAESGPQEIGDGDQVLRIQSIIPDDRTEGDVTATFFVANFPDEAERTKGPYTLTKQTSVRFTARQARIRVEEAVEGAWRVGTIRVGVLPGGNR